MRVLSQTLYTTVALVTAFDFLTVGQAQSEATPRAHRPTCRGRLSQPRRDGSCGAPAIAAPETSAPTDKKGTLALSDQPLPKPPFPSPSPL
jgi:hypothetical protein